MDDQTWMRRALTLARRGWGQTAPNPLVGAVVVRDGKVVGEGCHERYGGPHAEANALRKAGKRAAGATLYVTLEPCNHWGKQPPCADAVVRAGIARVVIAFPDPHPVARGGAAKLTKAGLTVDWLPLSRAEDDVNAPFFFAATHTERPYVTLKLAISADGFLAPADRSQHWLTGAEARRYVHGRRANVDAVAVGIGTVLADDPDLTVRAWRRKPRVAPRRVVLDHHARLPLVSKLVKSAKRVPVELLTTAEAAVSPAADALRGKGVATFVGTDLPDHMRKLRTRGVRHLLVEGGAGIAEALIGGQLVDELIIFTAPAKLGRGALLPFGSLGSVDAVTAGWRVVEQQAFGDDSMTVYRPA